MSASSKRHHNEIIQRLLVAGRHEEAPGLVAGVRGVVLCGGVGEPTSTGKRSSGPWMSPFMVAQHPDSQGDEWIAPAAGSARSGHAACP